METKVEGDDLGTINAGFELGEDTDATTGIRRRRISSSRQQTEEPNEVTDTEVNDRLLYGLNDTPTWYTSILLGLQHSLLCIGGLIGIPVILGPSLCMNSSKVGYVGQVMVLNSQLFICGILTFLQTTFGTRLPILQGGSYTFFAPAFAILSLPQNQCPTDPINPNATDEEFLYNDTDGTLVDGEELWQRRMRQLQGSLAVASVVELVLGLTGAIGFLMRFIGPLTIAPSITLLGLSLYGAASSNASIQWGVAFFTIAVVVTLSQYCANVHLPVPFYSREKKWHLVKTNIFQLFPLLIAIGLAWLLCLILTKTGALPDDPSKYGYRARTDVRISVVEDSPWFMFPYPGQWGLPSVTGAGVVGMLAAILAGIIESIGDYYACAKLCEAPPLPEHALNRGITFEGFGCILCGVIGTGVGSTSYSGNIGAIGITRVGSRRVLQVAGLMLFLLGMLGKFGAVLVLIPDPVLGGLFCVIFGMIVAIGISNLQHVDLNSSRNLFIIGFSIFMGLMIPIWITENPSAINTGVAELDQILLVLLQTSIFIGGTFGAILDNTIPGTREERGLKKWNVNAADDESLSAEEREAYRKRLAKCYDLPFSTNWRFSRYVPIFPEYRTKILTLKNEEESNGASESQEGDNGHRL